jgi:hypothetical protein
MSEFLIVGGAVVGYIFTAGIVAAVMSGGDLDDLEDNWVLAAVWPITLAMLAIFAVFMLPVGIFNGIGATADFLADRKKRKEREVARHADLFAEIQNHIDDLERDLGIGGQQ